MRILFFVALGCASLWSLPQSPSIIEGQLSFSSLSFEELEIVATDRAILEWRSFDIETHETARFRLPGATSSVLNRVVDAMPSRLLGRLESNGQVILINPNGILVGKDSFIDVGSFIGSTLDIQNQVFLAKEQLKFVGTSTCLILNEGSIRGKEGDVLLVGHDVKSTGSIESQNGIAALLGGHQVMIKPNGMDRIFIRPATEGFEEDIFSSAFTHPEGDTFDLVPKATLKGSIVDRGGEVYVLGEYVELSDEAMIDVSHPAGGGQVRIGGDFQGENDNLSNAAITWVGKNVKISASALENGDGGRVIVWADRETFFGGTISAPGKGDGVGGFAEVSAKRLHYQGLADLRDECGKTGTLLLDPCDITIDGATTPDVIVVGACPPLLTYSPGLLTTCISGCPNACVPGSSHLLNTTINTNLSTCNVIVTTLATPCAVCLGDILVQVGSPITWATGTTLTLNAANNIFVMDNIQNNTAAGAVTLNAGGSVFINNINSNNPVSVGSQNGVTTVNAGLDITLQGGNTGAVANSIAHIGFFPPSGSTSTGLITVNCGRDLTLTSGIGVFSRGAFIGHGADLAPGGADTATVGANITVNVGRDLTMTLASVSGFVCCDGAAQIGHGGFGDNNTFNQDGTITVNAGRDIILQSLGNSHGICLIGHGMWDIAGGFNQQVSGAITVRAGQDINITSLGADGSTFRDTGIGHSLFTFALGTDSFGDVDVAAGRDIFMTGGPAGGFQSLTIGHCDQSANHSIFSNIRVQACRNINLDPGQVDKFGIGSAQTNINGGVVIGTVTVLAGSNINILPTLPMFPVESTVIGYNPVGGTVTTTTYVAAGNMINVGPGPRNIGIGGQGDVNVAAGGTITVQAFGSSNAFIGTDAPVGPNITRIWSGQDIIGINAAGGGLARFGRDPALVFGPFSLDMRAGGDILIPTSYQTTGAAFIFLEADTQLSAGALWNGAVSSVDGAAIPIPIGALCIPFTASSAAIFVNGVGSVLINPAPGAGPLSLQTVSGNLTIHSAPLSTQFAGPQNLNIGCTPGNDFCLTTTSGNIEVWGTNTGMCVHTDSFFNININQAITTTGSVFISAENNIHMFPTSSITSNGPTTLIVDNQQPFRPRIGPGAFIMDAPSFINTNGALLLIFTALQNLNSINGTLNGVFPFVPGPPFVCTNQEVWCSYFCDVTCPMSGVPFTISYKPCLPIVTQQAVIVIDEFLTDMHPYREFPGWMERFLIGYHVEDLPTKPEPYYIRKRHLNLIHHPKTYTQLNLFFPNPIE